MAIAFSLVKDGKELVGEIVNNGNTHSEILLPLIKKFQAAQTLEIIKQDVLIFVIEIKKLVKLDLFTH